MVARVSEGFHWAQTQDWESVLDGPVTRLPAPPGQYLEAASPDVYLALDPRTA
jgi:hypothetical protein